MTTRRRPINRPMVRRITPDAVAAFRARDRNALYRALDLKPWQANPLDAVGACPWPPGTAGHASWAEALALRAEIIKRLKDVVE
jgi:hypothetical protein